MSLHAQIAARFDRQIAHDDACTGVATSLSDGERQARFIGNKPMLYTTGQPLRRRDEAVIDACCPATPTEVPMKRSPDRPIGRTMLSYRASAR